jgi:hypothetical protein
MYVMFIYTYHIRIHAIIHLLFNFAINHKKLLYNYLQMNTKLKRKLFKP